MQLDTRRFRPHQVLGDAQHYEAVLEEEQQRLQAQQRAGDDQTNAPAQSDDPWSCIDPDSVPKDVWEAAQLLGEKGLRLLQIYRELADQRETALQQMTLNQTRRAQQQQQQQQSFLASNSQAVHSSTTLQQQQQQQPPGSGRSRSPLIQPATARPGPNDPAGLGGSCLQSSSSSSWHNSSVSAAAAMGAAAASKASAAPGQLLTKRTVMDSIVESHDERVLARWAAQQAAWQAQVAELAAATGKDPKDVTLSRGDEWRQKLELLAALEVAVPAAAAAQHKVNKARLINADGGYNSTRPNSDGGSGSKGSIREGGSVEGATAAAGGTWMATLRNANERFVAIGNIFSGLFLSIHGRNTVAAAGLTTIRKPTLPQPTGNSAAAAGILPGSTTTNSSSSISIVQGVTAQAATNSSSSNGSLKSSSVLRRRSWMDDPYLTQKLTAGASAVKALAPAAPEAASLVVCGSSLDCASLACSLAVRPVGLADVEARLAVADPGLHREYQAAQQVQAIKAAAATAAAAEQARRAAARAAAGALPHPGPHLEADTDCLSLHYAIPAASSNSDKVQPVLIDEKGCVVGAAAGSTGEEGCTAATATLRVSNTGTAAVYYSWASRPQERAEQAVATSSGCSSGAQQGEQLHQQQAGSVGQLPDEPCTFYLPNQKGVILPGEVESFRFSFKAGRPGTYHCSWVLSTHPPLQPDPNAPAGSEARKRGHALTVALKGVAVAEAAVGSREWAAVAGSATMGLVQRQQQLEARLDEQCRDTQVQSVLALLLNSVMQQAALRQQAAAKAEKRKGAHTTGSAVAAAAAKWAAANPPAAACLADGKVGSSSSSSSGGFISSSGAASSAAEGELTHYYYHPELEARLSEIYSKALLLQQPPAPPPEPKKGGRISMAGERHSSTTGGSTHGPTNAHSTAGSAGNSTASNNSNSNDPAAELPALPETWDLSVSGLRVALARLSGLPAHKQAAAVLKQQAEAALRAAAVPSTPSTMVEASCRHVLLQLVGAVPAAADAAQAAAAVRAGSEAGSVASGHTTHRARVSAGSAATADEHTQAAELAFAGGSSSSGGDGAGASHSPAGVYAVGHGGSTGSVGGGAVTHRAKAAAAAAAAAAQAPAISQEQYHQLLADSVWTAARQQLEAFETVLRQHQMAAAAQLDAGAQAAAAAAEAAASQAAAGEAGAAGSQAGHAHQERLEQLCWTQFVLLRRKQQLGLAG